jgi:hypothetical protein
LSDFLGLKRLKILGLKGMDGLDKLSELEFMEIWGGTTLDLSNNTSLKDITLVKSRYPTGLEQLHNLEVLRLMNPSSSPQQLSIEGNQHLKHVTIRNIDSDSIYLKNLPKLNHMSLTSTKSKILHLENLGVIKDLDLSGMPNLEKIIFGG